MADKKSIGKYFSELGPGYLQSAMTLGAGTAFSAIFAGAAFGYQLIWVAPVAMALGVVMLSAIAHQTLSTGMNPFQAMNTYAGKFFGYGWAISAIISSIIWHFAQYALAAAMMSALARRLGWDAPNWLMGLIALALSIGVALLYSRSSKMVRTYENILKGTVWFIILCFLIVVIKSGIPSPSDLFKGFIPSIPDVNKGVTGITLVVSGLAAAVGANMAFIYPYTLRKRGWGREERWLAKNDLIWGMWLPYSIAAILMVIAAGTVFHYQSPELFTGKGISPVTAAEMLAAPDRLGEFAGFWIFGLGVVAMALSSIIMQMLAAGYAFGEMFNWPEGSTKRTLGTILPGIGVLGSVFWTKMALWVAVPTNIICGFLLPIAYIGFIKLQKNKDYLKEDTPKGLKGQIWYIGMIAATLILVVGLVRLTMSELPKYLDLFGF